MIYPTPRYRLAGDRAFLVELGDEIHPSVNEKVRELFVALKGADLDGVVELVPAYRSIMVVFDPSKTRWKKVREAIEDVMAGTDPAAIPTPGTFRVPVAYGGDYGPDLKWVADYHGIGPEEVIRLHTEPVYTVYMIGFTPGFAYLGELPHALVTPRRATPRTTVPGGSVAIAQNQTGVYPVQSPGGWQIIGRTPLRLFDPEKWPPVPLEMGGKVRFFSIKEEEMAVWEPRSWK